MLKYLIPDLICKDVKSVDFKKFKENGYNVLVFDIDNTLAPYEVEKPDSELKDFLFELKKDFNIVFVSNNKGDRVQVFNSELFFPYFSNAKKPLKKIMSVSVNEFKSFPEKTICIGDQIFTDVLCGNRCGFYTILVDPINDKKTLFFKAKRLLEIPIKNYYYKKRNI